MPEVQLDPADLAAVRAALGEDYQALQEEAAQEALTQQQTAEQAAHDRRAAAARLGAKGNNAQLLAKSKIESLRRKAQEKAADEQRRAAGRKDTPSARVAALEQPVNPDAGGAGPAPMNTADLSAVPVGSQGGGPQFIQEGKAGSGGGGGDTLEAPGFTVSGRQTSETGPYQWTPYMTGPATRTRSDVEINENALDPGDVLRARIAERVARQKQNASQATLLGGTIGLMLLEDPAKGQAAINQVREQYGDEVAERTALEAIKVRSGQLLKQRGAEVRDKLIEQRQSKGRDESDAMARNRLGLSDALVRSRAEEREARDPNRASAQVRADIQAKILKSGLDSLSPNERTLWDAANRPITINDLVVQEITKGGGLGGTPSKPATDDDVAKHQALYQAEYGKVPSAGELRGYMKSKGYAVP